MQPVLATLPNSGLPASVKRRAEDQLVRAAGLMILTPQGEALFLRYGVSHEYRGDWGFPAGEIENNEDPKEACIRETREETGWVPQNEVKEVDSSQNEIDFTTFATITGNHFIPELSDEHDAWCWAPLDNPPEPLHPGVKETIDSLLTPVVQDEFVESEHPREEHGKFTSGGSSKSAFVSEKIKSRVDDFIKSNQAKQAITSAAKKALGAAKEHHNELLAGAVSFGLYHILGADFPMDVEEALHHEIEHLSTNIGVAKSMAISMMKDVVGNLRGIRSSRAMDSEDEIDAALSKLVTVLDHLEQKYKGAKDAADSKIKRDAFLYLEDPDESKFAQCKTCWLFDKQIKRCEILPDDFEVNSEDSCGYYLEGEFQLVDAPKVKPGDVGFVKSTKVRCENCYYSDGEGECRLYQLLNTAFPQFFELDTKINSRGCCNAFQSAE